MISVEKLNEYLNSKDLDNERIKECLMLFKYDSEHDNQLMSKFYDLFKYVSRNENREYFHTFHLICLSYINAYKIYDFNPQTLFFIEVEYYFQIGAFGQSLHHINAILDNPSSTSSFIIAATNYALTILFRENLVSVSGNYIKHLEETVSQIPLNIEDELVFLIDMCDIYAQAGEYQKYLKAQGRIEAIFSEKNKSGNIQILESFNDTHKIYYKLAFSDKTTLNKQEIYQELENIMTNIETNDVYFDEYSTIILPVFEVVSDMLDNETIIRYIKKIFKMEISSVDKLGFYRYIFEEIKVSKEENIVLYNDYIDLLKSYYCLSVKTKRKEVLDELTTYSFEKEYTQMKEKYKLDPLTGCFNRFALTENENDILPTDCAVIYIDIDYLKKVNDQWGHYIGDLYIKTFAKNLLNEFPMPNQCIRCGGDEFVVIFEECSKELVDAKMNHLVYECNKVKQIGDYRTPLHFSSGIYYNQGNITLKDAISHADKAMYCCKKGLSSFEFYNEENIEKKENNC